MDATPAAGAAASLEARYRNPGAPGAARTPTFLDPLDEDRLDDDVVVTTRRGIVRVALVAAETAGRFQREALAHDPMAWMLAPRTLFGGANAIDACLDRDACMRGILIHGLSLGLDAEPSELDALLPHDEDAEPEPSGGADAPRVPLANASRTDPAGSGPRLFTATVVACDGFETVHAFHASLADDEAQIAGRLYMRMGTAMADAVIVEGFDPDAPLVAALVAPALCDTLALVAADPDSPLAAGLDLNVEQRFLG